MAIRIVWIRGVPRGRETGRRGRTRDELSAFLRQKGMFQESQRQQKRPATFTRESKRFGRQSTR
ncbi:MAG TPA: hypothetical protein VKB93_19685 [Thermoanaerobaculia bacterium]|nr:hypothetical protein [Thermoanaerobaculia bacterium]